VRGRGVFSLVNRGTLLELRSELRSDALLATTIDFSTNVRNGAEIGLLSQVFARTENQTRDPGFDAQYSLLNFSNTLKVIKNDELPVSVHDNQVHSKCESNPPPLILQKRM